MHLIDWLVLGGTLLFIVIYGVWKTRQQETSEDFLKGKEDHRWWLIGISIMATQASAITFLSTPGQAFEDGLRFVQFYFGLPLAMIILAVVVVPLYYKLKVYTAYEFLEDRFDLRTRSFAAFLFLVQRGLAAGITIYAPAIILSTIMGWNLNVTIFIIGILVIIYVTSGGTEAVSQTHKQQMAVMMGGMVVVLIIIFYKLPDYVSIGEAITVAGVMGRINAVDFSFDLGDRYTFWSAMLGGTFLFLSYFGTDQSQVQRYLSGRSLKQAKLGLLFNGLLKVPMQFFILFVGVMVFVFYQFTQPPVRFNHANVQQLQNTQYEDRFNALKQEYTDLFNEKQAFLQGMVRSGYVTTTMAETEIQQRVIELKSQQKEIRQQVNALIHRQNPELDTTDTDYVFIT